MEPDLTVSSFRGLRTLLAVCVATWDRLESCFFGGGELPACHGHMAMDPSRRFGGRKRTIGPIEGLPYLRLQNAPQQLQPQFRQPRQ